jgi:hypothetical protein
MSVRRINAAEQLAKELKINIGALFRALSNNKLDLDFRKVTACGYEGATEQVYLEDTSVCTCCKGYVVRDSGEYSNCPECSTCGASEGLCYECATGGPGCC